MSRLKRRNFRIFPGRLPQSWMQVSHGAQGFAFHWWRVFEDEAVTLPVDCLAPSLGLHSKARRYVAEWLAELVASKAIERLADGSLRMLLVVQSERQADAEATPSERPANGERTVNERSSDGERTLPQRSSGPKLPESIGGRAPENAQTDRQTDKTYAGARDAAFGAQRMSLLFRKRYLETRRTEPSMGGRNIGDFAHRVENTARAQCMDPEALFASALETWLLKPHGDVEQRAPYAAFAQAWGELTGSSRPRSAGAVRGLNAPEDV